MSLADTAGMGLWNTFTGGQKQAQDAQTAQLQQVGALQGILAKQHAMQQEQEMKGILAQVSRQAGGDPAKMVPLLLQTGTPVGIKLAEGMKGLLPSPTPRFAYAGQGILNTHTGEVAPNPYVKDDPVKAPPVRHRPVQVGPGYFDVTEEMSPNGTWSEIGRKPVRDPTIVMPRQPHYERGVDAQGNLSVVPISNGVAGAPIGTGLRPQGLTTSGNQQALALRRSHDSNPEVKLANSLEPKVGPIAQYVAEVGKGMGNAVGDAELVKLWLMTTHPKGDQISNMDYRTIEKMPDLWGRVKNVTGNFVFGKTLDADTRADMWKSVSEKFKATDAMRKKVRADVIGRGKAMNIDEALIFTPAQE